MSLLDPADIAAMNATLADFYDTPLTDIDGLPIVNARLLSVAGGGFTEDYDQPAGAGTPSWTGDIPAYLSQETILASPATRQSVQTGLDELVRTRLTFDSAGPDVDRGDTLTFIYGGDTLSRKVRDIAVDELAGVTTVTFEDG